METYDMRGESIEFTVPAALHRALGFGRLSTFPISGKNVSLLCDISGTCAGDIGRSTASAEQIRA